MEPPANSFQGDISTVVSEKDCRSQNVRSYGRVALEEGERNQVLDRHPWLQQEDELALWTRDLLQRVQDQRVRLQDQNLS